jgi:hypothetical protein
MCYLSGFHFLVLQKFLILFMFFALVLIGVMISVISRRTGEG